jgi:hypothetical protein
MAQVISEDDERLAVVRSLLALTAAVMNCRQMISSVQRADEPNFIAAFNESFDNIDEANNQIGIILRYLG